MKFEGDSCSLHISSISLSVVSPYRLVHLPDFVSVRWYICGGVTVAVAAAMAVAIVVVAAVATMAAMMAVASNCCGGGDVCCFAGKLG